MAAATSADRNQESIGNTMGAPGVEAQQKLEQQPPMVPVSSSPQHAEGETGQKQQQQPESSGTSSQQAAESGSGQQETKS